MDIKYINLLSYYLAVEDAGVYPRSTVENGETKKRTPWQNGWNEAVSSILRKVCDIDDFLSTLPKNLVEQIAEDNVGVYVRKETPKLYINCNDLFAWGCADSEDLPIDALPHLEKAVEDCGGDWDIGGLLYCARNRKVRPQGAFYSYIPNNLWHLFDSCGEERETGFGNPYKPGEYKNKRE